MNVLKLGFKDNVKSRVLLPDGTYSRIPITKEPFRSQEQLHKMVCETLLRKKEEKSKLLIPVNLIRRYRESKEKWLEKLK